MIHIDNESIEELMAGLRAEAIDLLKETAVINFVKADGTERTMIATRNNDLIPAEHHPKEVVLAEGQEPKPENTDIVKCFDLEANGWRSFRVDSLIGMSAKG